MGIIQGAQKNPTKCPQKNAQIEAVFFSGNRDFGWRPTNLAAQLAKLEIAAQLFRDTDRFASPVAPSRRCNFGGFDEKLRTRPCGVAAVARLRPFLLAAYNLPYTLPFLFTTAHFSVSMVFRSPHPPLAFNHVCGP